MANRKEKVRQGHLWRRLPGGSITPLYRGMPEGLGMHPVLIWVFALRLHRLFSDHSFFLPSTLLRALGLPSASGLPVAAGCQEMREREGKEATVATPRHPSCKAASSQSVLLVSPCNILPRFWQPFLYLLGLRGINRTN